MNREEALKLLKEKISKKNLIKHMFACEVCMGKLANYFNEDEEKWRLAGLLHDLDYELTEKSPQKHGFLTVEELKKYDIGEDILNAILAHPGHKSRDTLMEKALYSIDPLTGLIVASALMHPDKKLKSLDIDFIMRRFKEKRFAAGADREQIKSIEETGLDLEAFIKLCLNAMQEISKELGL